MGAKKGNFGLFNGCSRDRVVSARWDAYVRGRVEVCVLVALALGSRLSGTKFWTGILTFTHESRPERNTGSSGERTWLVVKTMGIHDSRSAYKSDCDKAGVQGDNWWFECNK